MEKGMDAQKSRVWGLKSLKKSLRNEFVKMVKVEGSMVEISQSAVGITEQQQQKHLTFIYSRVKHQAITKAFIMSASTLYTKQ